jgi:hypothetical protein
MRLRWFGPGWDDLELLMGNHVPTPVGERCGRCGRRIEADDQGVFLAADSDDARILPGPLHRECSERGGEVLREDV